MEIIDFKIHGSKRIGFSGIETLHYTPTEGIQIIIGTNGSGKSSLMDELHVLPADPASMLPGGYKCVKAKASNGKTYQLDSHYGKTNKHSFKEVLDSGLSNEMNTGGTLTAQKQLVFRTFGISPDVLRIVLGRTRFTTMPPTKRRDWILKLSDNDMDTAMNLFNKFKQGHRDAVGTHRHYINRLAEESTDVISRERIDELNKTIELSTKVIGELMEDRVSGVASIHHIVSDIEANVDLLAGHGAYIKKSRLKKPRCLYGINNLDEVKYYIQDQQVRMEMTGKQLNAYYADKNKIIDALRVIEESGVTGVDELTKITDGIEHDIIKLVNKCKFYSEIKDSDASEIYGAYLGTRDILIDQLITLRDNSDKYFTRDKLRQAREDLQKLDQKKHTFNQKIFKLNGQLDDYNTSRDITCPSCNTPFKSCIEHINPDEIKKSLHTLGEQLTAIENETKELAIYVEEAHDYMGQIKLIRHLIDNTPALQPLWTILEGESLFKVAPIKHTATINSFGQDLEHLRQIQILNQKLEMNRNVIEGVSQLTTTGTFNNDTHLSQLDDRIEEALSDVDQYRYNITEAKLFFKEMGVITEYSIEMKRAYDSILRLFNELLTSMKNKSIQEATRDQQLVLANATTALNQINRIESVLAEINREKDKAAERVKHYDILMKIMSPVDGLISRYIQNFIDVFIADINDNIDEVWSCGLEILPCSVDSNDVTCKFPLSVMGGYLVTPDISESSSGQADIIDLAFRINVIRYLGLKDMPLYLDEMAPTLDEVHRVNLVRYINGLMEEKVFSQMFMISHYAANHFAFPNSEILMLDARNIIQKPKEYNRHVTFTYRSDMAT